MAATPYKVAMKVVNSAGQIKSIPFTASDVTTAAWVFPSAGTELPLSALPCVIADVVYTAAGVDTSQVQVFVNGIDTGIRIYNSANLGTVYNRQIQSSPISIPAGASVKLIQLT